MAHGTSIQSMTFIHQIVFKIYEPVCSIYVKITCEPSVDSDQCSLISLLSAWRHFGSLATNRVPCKDSDQTVQKPRLIWDFARYTCNLVGNVMPTCICISGPSCSKLIMSLVNVSLKLWSLNMAFILLFLLKKCELLLHLQKLLTLFQQK